MISVNKFSIILYIYLINNIVISNQAELNVEPEEKITEAVNDDSNYILNKLNSNNLNHESNNELLNAFDSSIYYKIDWKERPSDFILDDKNDSIVTLTTKDLNRYHCVLPEINQQDQLNKEDSKIDPYTKIEHFFSKKKKICSYKLDSYWSYEICLNDYIRQFNGDILEKKHTQEYYLGNFKKENLERDREEYKKRIDERKAEGKSVPKIDYGGIKVPFIYVTMNDGTTCDLTNKPRKTIVYFVCDKQEKPQLESIEEVKSCEYEAIVSTSLLCDVFKEKKENEFEINCFPNTNEQSIKPPGIEQYELSELNSETLLQQIQEMMGNSKFKIEIKEIDMFNKQNTKIKAINLDKSRFMNDNDDDKDYLNKGMTMNSFITSKRCFASTYKIYWKYRVCFMNTIDMFHEDAGTITQTINLGKFDKAKHLKWLDKNQELRKKSNELNYLYSDGNICHETDRNRFVEVKLKCPLDTTEFSITLDEPKLCEYKVTIISSLICKLIPLVDDNGLLLDP